MRSVRLLLLSLAFLGFTSCASVDVPPDPVTKTASYSKAKIHYVDAGKGDIPLIFVHGWGGRTDFWRGELGELSKDYRVIALDLPSHGNSTTPKGHHTQQNLAKAVLAVMDAANVQRAVLVGHSMGGNIVRHVALMAPERVAGIVLADGAFLFPPHDAKGRAQWTKETKAFVRKFRGPKGDQYTRQFIDNMHGRLTPEWAKDEVQTTIMHTPRKIRTYTMEHFAEYKSWPNKQVMAPTLAVYAQSKELQPDTEDKLRSLFPDLEFVVWDGPGHFYILYEYRWLNAEIRAFMKAHEFN